MRSHGDDHSSQMIALVEMRTQSSKIQLDVPELGAYMYSHVRAHTAARIVTFAALPDVLMSRVSGSL